MPCRVVAGDAAAVESMFLVCVVLSADVSGVVVGADPVRWLVASASVLWRDGEEARRAPATKRELRRPLRHAASGGGTSPFPSTPSPTLPPP